MKRILVPTDFSDEALNAVKFAVWYAKQLNCGITIFNCYSLPPSGVTVMVDISDALRKTSEENLTNLRKHLVNLHIIDDTDVEYLSEPGTVVDVLKRFSHTSHYPLVVMGTHGSSGRFNAWVGSNTAAVSKNLDIPLLAVPASAEVKPPSKIVFTTDFKPLKNSSAPDFVRQLARENNSRLVFLNVHTSADSNPEAVRQSFHHWAEAAFNNIAHSYMFVNEDEIEVGIETAIQLEKPDLLVMIKHRYSLFENLFHNSITKKIVQKALLPVLILNG